VLTPQGAKTLKDIGKLYEKDGELKKIEIAFEDIIKLSKLLKRNRELFIKYALKYTEITVKHATAMKVFNRSIKQLGIPKIYQPLGEAM
jgi:hypothetical protein